MALEKYQNLSEEEKHKKRYRSLPEDEKQGLVEYRKRYSKMR